MSKLHVGNGGVYLQGWINLDKHSTYQNDLCVDVLQTFFEENSFEVIYSSHFFEHLLFPIDAVEFLNRAYRWLKPDGIFRIAVPDLELAVRAYYEGRSLDFLYGKEFKGYYHKDTPAERLNFFVRSWEHQMCYDFGLMKELLMDAGFINIQKKQANETNIPNFNFDRFIPESLYVECIK